MELCLAGFTDSGAPNLAPVLKAQHLSARDWGRGEADSWCDQ